MILVELTAYGIGVKVIVSGNVLSCRLSPWNIFSSTTVILPIVDQAQQQPDPVTLSFINHVVQCLQQQIITRNIISTWNVILGIKVWTLQEPVMTLYQRYIFEYLGRCYSTQILRCRSIYAVSNALGSLSVLASAFNTTMCKNTQHIMSLSYNDKSR